MYVASAPTPRLSNAGPMITAAVMKDGGTRTDRPHNSTATAATTAVAARLPPARATMRLAALSPRPVSVTMPTMMPAAAVVAATGSTPVVPAASARAAWRGPSWCDLSRKDSTKARIVAYATARNGDPSQATHTTVAH